MFYRVQNRNMSWLSWLVNPERCALEGSRLRVAFQDLEQSLHREGVSMVIIELPNGSPGRLDLEIFDV
ncbi:hypothetical protein Kisp02_73310 [Kineosporia sp. NBRC 101731]|nr:hypothetical protein Kisp02_73310 [Kineosporia sp. NBRC 101731]